MLHRTVPLALLAALLSCGGSQTDIGSPESPADTPPDETPAPQVRESTQDTITTADLRAHVELLSSDAYGGRETLTDGYEKAADYMVAQFKSYGLTPLPGRDAHRVPYQLERYTYGKDGNRIALFTGKGKARSNHTLALGEDYTPFNFSDSGSVENADVVFAGYGITAPELGWDDYKGLNVKGKVVLVLRHWPNEKDEKSKFKDTRHGLFTSKALNAQKHGAAAMLIVTDPRHHKPAEDNMSAPSFVRLPMTEEQKKAMEARAAKAAAAKAKAGKKGKKEPQLYAAHISQEAAEMLVATRRGAKKGSSLAQIQEQLDAGKLKTKSVKLRAQATVAVEAARKPVPVNADNVIGFLEGSDPVLKKQWVVIGGHYDHLGTAGGKGEGDRIYNGADDNASGTAGVLELAQAFGSLKQRPARSLVFVGFSGEEKGLLGSFAMMNEKQLDEDQIAFMLNLDMIGRNADKPVQIIGEAYGTTIKEVIDGANKEIGLDLEFGGTNYAGNSDHHAFYRLDIPMMFFFTGLHKDYHQLSDHADKIAFDRMTKIVRLGYGVIDRVANAKGRPSFIHNLGWLGARLELVGEGADAEATFTKIDDDSRASKAGIAVGDTITSIGGEVLAKPRKVGKRFRDIEPGNKVAIELSRAGKPMKIEVVRAKRGYLGVFPGPVTDEMRKKHGLGETEGVFIRGVTNDGPAAKAGIKEKDLLIRIAGVPVGNRTLGRELARIGAGEKVNITVIRGEERVNLTMVLGERTRTR